MAELYQEEVHGQGFVGVCIGGISEVLPHALVLIDGRTKMLGKAARFS